MKRFAFVALAAIVLPLPAVAAEFHAGDSLSFPGAAPAVGNTYAVAGAIYGAEQFPGDLFAVGGNINLYGRVAKDALLLGGTVIANGEVADDLRVAGGNITIGGNVGGELLAAGGSVNILPGAAVSRGISVAGGMVTIAANVKGDLIVRGGEVRIDGPIAGKADIKADKLTLGPKALIEGDLIYSAKAEAKMEPGAVVRGKSEFTMRQSSRGEKNKAAIFWAFFAGWAVKVLMVFAAAMILRAILRAREAVFFRSIRDKFWRELGVGFAALILVPIAAVIAIVTVVGALPGIAAMLLYAVLLVLAGPLAALWGADTISGWGEGQSACDVGLLAAAALALLGFIPVLGWIVCFGVFLLTLGATVDFLRGYVKLK